jgi:hypothetical protein
MNPIQRVLRVLVVTFALVGGVQPALALPITIDLTAGATQTTVTSSSWGNTWTYSSGGVTVTASAWSYTKDTAAGSNVALEAAQPTSLSSGLGVCSQSEGSGCTSAQQQLDNSGETEWALFKFSEPVDINTVRIDPAGVYDSDVTYWAGQTAPTFTGNLDGMTYASVTSLFGAPITDEATESDAGRNVSIGGGLANYLLIGAQKDGTNDYFKIKSISVTAPLSVPEPATLLLLGSAMATLGLRRRRRQRLSAR